MNSKIIDSWKNADTEDVFIKKDMASIKTDYSLLVAKKMVFGTSGIRGAMGIGPSKINEFTVAAAVKAYVKFLKADNKDDISIAISHDNRGNSLFLSNIASSVLLAMGVDVFVFEKEKIQPTSLLSYAIKRKKMTGGLSITAGHNSSNNNGIKFLNSNGALLIEKDMDKIQKFTETFDWFDIRRSKKLPIQFSDDIEDEYIKDILKMSDISEGKLSLTFSPLNGTAWKFGPKILNGLGNDVSAIKNQMDPCCDFKYSNPENGKAFLKSSSAARKINADAMFVTDSDAGRLGVAIKYKRRYKYLNGNQLACLYLEYKLKIMKKNGTIPKDGYVVSTFASSSLFDKIAQKYGINSIKTNIGFANIAELIKNQNGTMILAFEESYSFLINKDISMVKDSLQMMAVISNMFSYFKLNKINAYSQLLNIYKEYGIHRTYKISKKINISTFNKLIKAFKRTKKINSHVIKEVIDYRKESSGSSNDIVKVIFKNDSSIILRPSKTDADVKIYIENIGIPRGNIDEIITFEKEIESFIKENTEEFKDKKFSWKVFLKYTIFVLVLAGTIALVFNVIYSDVSGSGKTNITDTFSAASAIWHLESAWPWLIMWVWRVISMFISAWSKKRMFMVMGESVKSRHLVLSAIMGGIIAFITPFTIGGDAVGYWYLRRKGVKRAPLIATLSSSTLIGEAKFTVQTAILVGIGWPIYQHIFSGSIESKAALLWFFAGLFWSIFSTTMIFIVTLSKRFQNLIITKGIKFLEWFRYVHIYDPWRKAADLRYEFYTMRSGMKRIWTTWYLPIELLFYSLVPLFFQPTTIIYAFSGLIRTDLGVDPYFSVIVGNDIIGTANAMSFLPGGSGTGEWLSRTVNAEIFAHNTIALPFSSMTVANGNDFFWKMISTWPWLIISATLTIFTITTESSKTKKHKRSLKIATWLSIGALAIAYLITYFCLY